MKLGVVIASALLLAAVLLSGCPKQESMLEKSKDPNNIQTTPDPSKASTTEGTSGGG
jgi:hypothetical protein